jgi:stage II sporulation protein R
MRNKHLVWAYIIILSIGTILSLYIPKNEVTAKEAIVIPNEAIRLRILANSDHESDQVLKRLVRDEVNIKITEWVSELTSIDDARSLLQSKLPEVQEIARTVMKEQGSNQSVKVDFGNVQFPTKLYGQFLYPAGEYEAILITLGEGTGANWWCVLYPPLCFLDFSSGVAVSDGFEEEKEAQQTETKSKKNVEQKPDVKSEEKEAQQQASKSGEQGAQQQALKSDEKDSQQQETKSEENVEQEPEVKNEENVKQEPEVKSDEKEAQQQETKSEKKKDKEHVAQSKNNKLQMEESNKKEPVFVETDEQPVEVKFFVKELWEKLFE